MDLVKLESKEKIVVFTWRINWDEKCSGRWIWGTVLLTKSTTLSRLVSIFLADFGSLGLRRNVFKTACLIKKSGIFKKIFKLLKKSIYYNKKEP